MHPIISSTFNYSPDFLSNNETADLFNWLVDARNVVWRAEWLLIRGKQVRAPRQTAWFGEQGVNYRYSGLDHRCGGWPEQLAGLRKRVCEAVDAAFNFVLLNRYAHGDEYMGWHRDDEAGIRALVASVSLGASRRMRMRKGPGYRSRPVDLEPGSLLIFDGTLQHTLTKTMRPVGERINLTFRQIENTVRGDDC